MGLLFSIVLGGGNNNIASGPTGPPYNNYWRARFEEDSWKLREMLLDGDEDGIVKILGLPTELESALDIPTDTEDTKQTSILPRANSNPNAATEAIQPHSSSCMARFLRCFFGQKTHSNASQNEIPNTDERHHRNNSFVHATELPTESPVPPDPSTLATFELHNYTWEDDGGNTALHYLALGRTASSYLGVNLHVPALYENRSPSANSTVNSRSRLISLLVKYGRITSDTFNVLNMASASPIHFAAAHGELEVVQALLQNAGSDLEILRLQADPSGMLPSDLALSCGHIRCSRELGLSLLSNLGDIAARCEAILMDAAPSADPNVDWTAGLEMREIQVNIQSTDSQRITLIRERERELSAALAIPLVSPPFQDCWRCTFLFLLVALQNWRRPSSVHAAGGGGGAAAARGVRSGAGPGLLSASGGGEGLRKRSNTVPASRSHSLPSLYAARQAGQGGGAVGLMPALLTALCITTGGLMRPGRATEIGCDSH